MALHPQMIIQLQLWPSVIAEFSEKPSAICACEQSTYSAMVSYYLLQHKAQAIMNHKTGSY